MNLTSTPTIRFDIEAMGERLHSLIVAHGEDVADAIKDGVLSAVDELDIELIAREHSKVAIEKAIKGSIDAYFSYGSGADIVREMVGDSVRRK